MLKKRTGEITMPIFALKTDAKLLARLEDSAKQPVTKEEFQRQRVSFVFGNLSTESTITRQQVEEVIARIEGETVAV